MNVVVGSYFDCLQFTNLKNHKILKKLSIFFFYTCFVPQGPTIPCVIPMVVINTVLRYTLDKNKLI